MAKKGKRKKSLAQTRKRKRVTQVVAQATKNTAKERATKAKLTAKVAVSRKRKRVAQVAMMGKRKREAEAKVVYANHHHNHYLIK